MIKKLSDINTELLETKNEILSLRDNDLNNLNDIGLQSKAEILHLTTSFSEQMAKLDSTILEQQRLATSFSMIEEKLNHFKKDLDIFQTKIEIGFSSNQQLITDSEKQIHTLIEYHHQLFLQKSDEENLKANKQLKQFTNYSKFLLITNIISFLGVFVLIYLLLTLN